MRIDVDVLVVGGGVAGATAALLLAEQGRQVALVDAQAPASDWPGEDYDPRVIALSPGSAAILEAVGAWPGPWADRMAAYGRMQVHAGRGSIEFKADQHGLQALGWIAEIPALRATLWQRIESNPRIQLFCPDRLGEVELDGPRARARLESGPRLSAELLIASDGARSPLRRLAGIEVDEWHYNQHALIAPVRTERPNDGLAWQRFTDFGPLALLPLADGRSSIVWSQASERTLAQVKMPAEEFLFEINACQDSPMGEVLEVGARHALPLVRRRARRLVQGPLVLLGDAARSVHPLAGQGLNLGLADAAALAECLTPVESLADRGRALDHYQRWRRSASELIGGGIHAINETVRLPAGLGKHLLGAGFMLGQGLWPARELFVERACGFDRDSPALARRARAA
ncbi:FAD-dependent oxidoreductase [Wenzhouxiangella marina]|uniref:Uncharacterized protein n=1 Tax=Wenzhouxiangella marina TaxID=1579979 RepID=A0A0K0XUW7_9GAMM|nr:FAD-dependent oxidoreductase [Wenzhouxiangella marina]AKS41417.1 hypothetical protein WM2015_1040 [Wenzhouxiangella marina]MBB6086829.1 ubiquinone biosynthesis UbiH/UbiF/VisC/COQ6 family hydroxylase [Wenzhouxiangella marina]